MKKNNALHFLILCGLFFSCTHTSYRYVSATEVDPGVTLDDYPFHTRIIMLNNDSVLTFTRTNGSLAASDELLYKRVDNEIIVDSTDIERNEYARIVNSRFIFHEDSLKNIETGEVFYREKYRYVITKSGRIKKKK